MSTALNDSQLAARMREVMKLRGVSMRSLSADLGIPYRSVQNYLSGEVRIPATFLLLFCSHIGVEADYFIYGNFHPSHEELYDALFSILLEAGCLPDPKVARDDETGGEVIDSSERIAVARRITAVVSERYDHYRRTWLTEKHGSRGLPFGERRPSWRG
ncbi:helix-turn-helix domain-containing protein [Chelatococcus caeni]|uniref:helix-turn-helix domain-containing protein n=1 Tax=Chelatococcus caeni TaxID=1348468 RepID=UPI003CCCD554